jgi:phage internal scaffolding protein
VRVALDCSAEGGGAKQSMKAECDINNIMRRFVKTGVVEHFATGRGSYGFASSASFHEAMLAVNDAQRMFDELPATVRKRFNNDPATFLDFATNKDNLEELRKLGLAKPEAKPSRTTEELLEEISSKTGAPVKPAPIAP